jgi:UDPglucose--hexose-1-phosphate uridylyltransferase
MPELRQNLATKEWVIIATERAKRPEEFIQVSKERVEERPIYVDTCPFCPGNEERDLERLSLPDPENWQVRVVNNRFPALQEQGELDIQTHGLYRSMTGIGHHELVVESRQHNTCPATETHHEIAETLRAFQIRGKFFESDSRIEHMIFFKNHGVSAGASLVHPHAQLLALPIIPSNVSNRSLWARQYYEENHQCVFCHMRKQEEEQKKRIILKSKHFIAFIPYAAFSPFHIWILPLRHSASYLDITEDERHDLAIILQNILQRLYKGLNDPDYNYVIRTSPTFERHSEYLHWYLAIIPRVSRSAGFELGTGMFINTALPEASAEFIRNLGPNYLHNEAQSPH